MAGLGLSVIAALMIFPFPSLTASNDTTCADTTGVDTTGVDTTGPVTTGPVDDNNIAAHNIAAQTAIAIVIPLLIVAVVNTLIVICIILCHKSPRFNNGIMVMCGKARRYYKPRSHRSLSHARRLDIHSATELTMTMESHTNGGEMSTEAQNESGETEQDIVGGVKRSTISQQNEAYGVHRGFKRSTVTQQNEAYGMTNTATPVVTLNTKQPDTDQKSDEYSYVRFQRQ